MENVIEFDDFCQSGVNENLFCNNFIDFSCCYFLLEETGLPPVGAAAAHHVSIVVFLSVTDYRQTNWMNRRSGRTGESQLTFSRTLRPWLGTLHWFLLNNHFHWPRQRQWKKWPTDADFQTARHLPFHSKCCSNHSHSRRHFGLNRSECLHSTVWLWNSREISQTHLWCAAAAFNQFQVNHVKLRAKWLPIITIIGAGKRIVMQLLTNFSFFFPSNSVVSAVDFVNGRGHVTARVRSSLLKKLEI